MSLPRTMTPAQAGSMTWDVVVAGAGPAGAIAARQLARDSSLCILLLDRAAFPRDKVCGGCLSAPALGELCSIGLESLVNARSSNAMRRLEIRAGRKSASVSLPGGAVVERRSFDAALVQAAIDQGVTFISEALVNPHHIDPGTNDGDEHVRLTCRDLAGEHEVTSIRTRLVIDATGLAGRPDHRRRDSYVGAGTIVTAPVNAGPGPGQIIMTCGRHGYVGMTRADRDRLVVAAAWDPTFVHAIGGPTTAAMHILESNGSRDLANLVSSARWRHTPFLTQRPGATAGFRRLSIGDSAGYVEPFTGEGMNWAIRSALAVGPVVRSALESTRWSRDVERRWTRILIHRLAGQQRACRLVAHVLRRPMLTSLALTVLARFPSLATPFTGKSCPVVESGVVRDPQPREAISS